MTQPVHEVTQARVVLGRTEPGFPDPVAIADAVRRGATVQILGLEAWHGAARQLCAELQTIGRMRVGAVAFLTGPGEYGLAAHRDDAHVVAVQIAGEKRWELFAPTDTEGGAADTPIADASPIATVSLSPGQALYVPLGCPHRACAGSSGSLHLSFTIRPIALPEAMKALTAPLCSIPSNREHMDGTREERVRQVAELLAAMARWAQRQEPERVVDALEKRWIGSPDGEVDAFADILDTMDSKAGHIAGAA